MCNSGADYNATACRLNSYRALVDAFKGGLARSIGVSNYDAAQMDEIVAAGLPWPAVNQIPIHLYRSSSQMQTILYAQRHGITVNAYSPLGVPDWHVYPAPMSPTELQDPLVLSLAAKYNKSPAQILVGWLWQLGITSNPRTLDPAHMAENLNAFEQTLTDGEVNALLASPQDWCTVDSGDCEFAAAAFRAGANRAHAHADRTQTISPQTSARPALEALRRCVRVRATRCSQNNVCNVEYRFATPSSAQAARACALGARAWGRREARGAPCSEVTCARRAPEAECGSRASSWRRREPRRRACAAVSRPRRAQAAGARSPRENR